MMYPEVEKYLNNKPFDKKYYGERIFNCIEELSKQISADKQMHAWMRCKDNRYEDLYDEFIKRVENLIPIGNDVNDPEFEMYNMMHRQPFYNIWTNDVLRLIIKLKRESL